MLLKDIFKKIQFKPVFCLGFALGGLHFMAVPVFIRLWADIGAVVLLWHFFWRQRTYLSRSGYAIGFGLMLLAVALSAIFAYIPTVATVDIFNWLGSFLLFYIISAYIREKQDLQFVWRILFIGFCVIICAGFYQYFEAVYGPLIPKLHLLVDQARGLPRLSSLFIMRSGINVYSAYLALFLPVFLYDIFRRDQPRVPWTRAVLLAVIAFNLFFVASRALYVSLLAAVVFWGITSKYRKQILLVGALVVTLAIVAIPQVRATFYSYFDEHDSSNADHYDTFFYAVEQIKQRPLVGYGGLHLNQRLQQDDQGRWTIVTKKYRNQYTGGRFYRDKFRLETEQAKKDGVIIMHNPHNYYLGLWSEYGVLGLLGFLLILVIAYRDLSGCKDQRAMAMRLGLISFSVYCLFQDSLRSTIMAVFFITYLVLIEKQERLCKK